MAASWDGNQEQDERSWICGVAEAGYQHSGATSTAAWLRKHLALRGRNAA